MYTKQIFDKRVHLSKEVPSIFGEKTLPYKFIDTH